MYLYLSGPCPGPAPSLPPPLNLHSSKLPHRSISYLHLDGYLSVEPFTEAQSLAAGEKRGGALRKQYYY